MSGHRVITIDFTGTETESGKIFDTTNEAIAKQNGIYREGGIYRPVATIIGKGDVLHGMDEALKGMKKGESKTITLAPEKAFGERRKELVVVIPIKEFQKRKLQPFPGLIVDLNGQYGRVQTVSGGRVRVDLNNDLAGKTVKYDLKIVDEYTKADEKAGVLVEKFFPLKEATPKSKFSDGILTIELPKEIGENLKPLIAQFTKMIKEIIPEINKIDVVDSKEKKAKAPEKKE
ncbi:MAG: hypothetical protein COV47_04085 [Candidatus Diapherotrites archaeon CG11_big_fil_rev_8_21_14_0_20_37_9]|nr:MAG: hypothetical protein COV47_04085 [Candidatus Diapherotrites archaeon CG11_big_fil_rev_8_21_14_0_20_37_9]